MQPCEVTLDPVLQERLNALVRAAGRVVVDELRATAHERLAAISIEGAELPAGIHVLTEREREELLRGLEFPEDLWTPYLSWNGDPSTVEQAMHAVWDQGVVDELQAAFEELDPQIAPSTRLLAAVSRWVTEEAGRELQVVPEFVAFPLALDHGDVWPGLWLSAPPAVWDRLRALDLVPAQLP